MSVNAQPGELIVVGRVAGVYGVKGWVRVQSYTDPVDNIFKYQPWLLGTGHRAVSVEQSRSHGSGSVAKISGLDDRDAAHALVGAEIRVHRADLPRSRPGEYYWSDLVGMAVSTTDGCALGVVDHLIRTGANDVLVVEGIRRRLIPFVSGSVVRGVDEAARSIEVDWDPDF